MTNPFSSIAGLFGASGSPAIPQLSQPSAGTGFSALFPSNSSSSPAVPNVGGMSSPNMSYNVPATPAIPTTQVPTSAPTGQPNQTVAPGSGTPGYTYVNGQLTSEGGKPVAPIIPNTTTAATQPNPTTSGALITTPSGAVVNQYTGALVTPPPSQLAAPSTVYGGSTQGLLASGQNGSPAVVPAISSLQGIASSNPAQYGEAGLNTATQNLADFETGLQTSLGNTGKQAIPMPFIQGQQQVIGQQNQGILSALSQAVTQAQTGLGYSIQGAGVQAGAANEAGALGVSQQGANQQGLQEAGALTAPVAGATFFGTPETGGMVGTGQQSMEDAVALQVQKLQNGTTDPASAQAALAAYGQAGTNALQAALGPNFSLPAATGATAATQANTSTIGTAQTGAAATGYAQAVQDTATMTAQSSQAKTQATNVTSLLSNLGLNTGVPDYNSTLNSLQTKLGSTGYTSLNTAMLELQNMYSQFLNSGGSTPTGTESQALAALNPNSSASQIQASIDQLNSAMDTRLSTQQTKQNSFASTLGTGGSGSSSATSGWGSLEATGTQ